MSAKIESYVKKWMDGHEPDTFIANKYGQYVYSAGACSLNLKVFFEELLKDYIEETTDMESCAGCRFYNSCGLRIDYGNIRCSDFLK